MGAVLFFFCFIYVNIEYLNTALLFSEHFLLGFAIFFPVDIMIATATVGWFRSDLLFSLDILFLYLIFCLKGNTQLVG